MLEKLAIWLPVILAWVGGAVMFVALHSADDIEKNLSTWRVRTKIWRDWLARRSWPVPLAILLLTGSSLFAGVLISPMLEYSPRADPKFERASAAADIGIALAPSESSRIYLEGHEHAVVVWSESLGTHYLLRNDGKVLRQIPDTDWEVMDWMNDDVVRNRLKLPPSCAPPRGGVARHWNNDPETWSKIGCRTWWCYMAALVQPFKKGTIIGPLKYGPAGDVGSPEASRVFVIFSQTEKEQREPIWLNYRSPEHASNCTSTLS